MSGFRPVIRALGYIKAMECKTRILLSWSILAFGILLSTFSSLTYSIASFAFIPFVFLRNTERDKVYYKNIGNNPGLLLKLLFTWMFMWLIYILFNYFQSKPIGSFTLTDTQLLLFIAPLFVIFIIYEVIYYLSCKKA